MVGLGTLGVSEGVSSSAAHGVSADGSIVVGNSISDSGSEEAYVWDQTHGMRILKDMLVNDFGLDMTGWRLQVAFGVSADGLAIVGKGINPNGDNEAFVAVIPEPATLMVLGLGLTTLTRRRLGRESRTP